MSKVFIINDMHHDFTDAKRYGELVYVTRGKIPIFKTSRMLSMLDDGLQDFTEDDYLLLSGPTLVCIMASKLLFSRLIKVKFLVFDAKEQAYVVRHL